MNVKLDHLAHMPSRAYQNDAGLDLKTPKRTVIHPGSSAIIDTGVHIDIPAGYYGKLESKSGLLFKHSIVCPGGVIDAGYTGSIGVMLENHGGNVYIFERGDKIAQLIIQPCETQTLHLVDDLKSDNGRGDNGFGSSGR